ncbi:hypothetical protein Bca101_094695 [Brassica carinata]
MTSKFIAAPPSRSRPPPDPPPQKLPLLGSLSPLEPLEPPGPSDPPDTSLVCSSLVHLYRRLSSAFSISLPCPSLMTSLVPDLFSTAWSSSRGDGSCQTSDLKTLRRALPFLCPRMMTILPSGKIYSTWFWSMNLLSDDQLTPALFYHNDQWLSFDSRKSLWVHHGNAGVYKFCWELRYVPSDIGVKPILLFTGVEESSSLMSNSFQEISHFTPLAITIHVHQVLNMLYSLLSCSYLSNYICCGFEDGNPIK